MSDRSCRKLRTRHFDRLATFRRFKPCPAQGCYLSNPWPKRPRLFTFELAIVPMTWGETSQPLLFSDTFVTNKSTCSSDTCQLDSSIFTSLMMTVGVDLVGVVFPNPAEIAAPLNANLGFLKPSDVQEIDRLYNNGAKVTSFGEMRRLLAVWLSPSQIIYVKLSDKSVITRFCVQKENLTIVVDDTGSYTILRHYPSAAPG